MLRVKRKLIIEQRINELKRLEAKRMDPTTTYDEMCEAEREGDMESARGFARCLQGWHDGGGFSPSGMDWTTVLKHIERILK